MSNQFETIPFTSLDGFECNLQHLLRKTPASKGPVMLVHGAAVRGRIYNSPNENNIISQLADAGYDVWLENWRSSIELEANEWDLDVVALNDHPAAIKKIVELTEAKEVKVIIHCQGSTSFMISAMLGLVPEVKVIISNAVSLHPIVPKYSVFKLKVLVPLVKLFFKFLNPQWGLKAPDLKSKLLRVFVRLTHREKDTLVGKFVSFTYGAGFPALWRLENLNKKTMDWIQHEFGAVPLSFFDHIKKCEDVGYLRPNKDDDTSIYVPNTNTSKARIALFAGEKNKCFLADSQRATFAYLDNIEPGRHSLHVLDTYSHIDIFLGKNAATDVFPLMIAELNKNE